MKKPKRAASDPPPSPAPWTPAHVALLLAALLLATLAVYQPAWHGAFLWDDDAHVTEAALLLYVVTLAPALGFVNVYPFRFSFVADHFQYLASVAVIAFVAAGTAIAARRYAEPGALVNAAVVLVVAAPLAGLSWRESHQYAAAETLYRTTIGRNPGAWMAHHNLAVIKARGSAADMDMAVAHATEAIRLNPTEADAHNTLGIALQRQGRLEEAAALYDAAIRLRPGRASAHNNLGTVRQAEGRLEEAIVEYRAAIVADPSYAEARNNLGFALGSLGRLDEAIAAYREALRLGPRADLPRDNLGRALYSRANELHTQNRLEEAVAGYREAVTFVSAPRAAEAHNDLGVALANLARAGGKSDR